MQKGNTRGFTLIELMITVAIVGILASVAIPHFQRHLVKSKTAEAKVNLKAIATSQIAYQAEFNTFVACLANPIAGVPGVFKDTWDAGTNYDDIGFAPKDNKVLYQYLVGVGTTGDLATSFSSTASGNIDGDANIAVYQTTESTPVDQTVATQGYY